MNEVTVTTTTSSSNDLSEIAERIRARIRRTTIDVIETGNDLITVKAQLDHGEFLKWIETEFSWTNRTAQRFMRAAEWAEGKSDIVSHLPTSTVYLLSAKTTPEKIQNQVVDEVKAGARVNHQQIEAQIRQERDLALETVRKNEQAQLRRQRRSPEHQKKQEREKDEAARRLNELERRIVEAVDILRRLPDPDFNRLVDLFIDSEYVITHLLKGKLRLEAKSRTLGPFRK